MWEKEREKRLYVLAFIGFGFLRFVNTHVMA